MTERLLTTLGISKYYRGYKHLVFILKLALEDENRLYVITKELYMAAAEHDNCDWRAIEHSIRVVLRVAWKRNPKELEEFMGYELFCQPKICEFLSAAVAYLQKQAALGV